jgi:hypothetical protein
MMDIAALYTFFNPTCTEQERTRFLALPIDHKIGRALSSLFQTLWQTLSQSFTPTQTLSHPATPSRTTAKTAQLAHKKINPKPVKNISKKTQLCLSALEKYAQEHAKVPGSAVDNGDCFYDAVRQSIERTLKKQVTIQELRTLVHRYVEALHKENPHNWISQHLGEDDYEELRDTVQFPHIRDTIPLWGRPDVEGKILANHFGLELHVLEINVLDDIIQKRDMQVQIKDGITVFYDKSTNTQYDHAESRTDGTKRMIKVCTPAWQIIKPEKATTTKKLEIAGYPGHFVPLFTK